MIISHPGLEELLSSLGFALAAALGGGEDSLYFQGPAVRVLKRGFNARLQGIGRFFSAFARSGMDKTGHIPPQEKLRQLQDLGAKSTSAARRCSTSEWRRSSSRSMAR